MMFTLDELVELIKKAVKFYAQKDGIIEDEVTSDIMRSIAECMMLHIARSLAEQRAKEAIEKRENLEDRLILLQAKLIEIEDWTVADESIESI